MDVGVSPTLIPHVKIRILSNCVPKQDPTCPQCKSVYKYQTGKPTVIHQRSQSNGHSPTVTNYPVRPAVCDRVSMHEIGVANPAREADYRACQQMVRDITYFDKMVLTASAAVSENVCFTKTWLDRCTRRIDYLQTKYAQHS